MNEVHLKGNLHQTPSFTVVSGVKEAWIWLNADAQWLPVLCRDAAAEAVCQCPSGAEVEVAGFIENVQVSADKWSLRVIATRLHAEAPYIPATDVRHSQKPRRHDDSDTYDYDDSAGEFLLEISPGFYYDAFDDEYVGDPDAPDYEYDYADDLEDEENQEDDGDWNGSDFDDGYDHEGWDE